jgi:hypothetical protein
MNSRHRRGARGPPDGRHQVTTGGPHDATQAEAGGCCASEENSTRSLDSGHGDDRSASPTAGRAGCGARARPDLKSIPSASNQAVVPSFRPSPLLAATRRRPTSRVICSLLRGDQTRSQRGVQPDFCFGTIVSPKIASTGSQTDAPTRKPGDPRRDPGDCSSCRAAAAGASGTGTCIWVAHLELIAIDFIGAIVLTGRSEALGWGHVFDEDNHKHA